MARPHESRARFEWQEAGRSQPRVYCLPEVSNRDVCELSASISASSVELKQMRLSTLFYYVLIWIGITAEVKRPALGHADWKQRSEMRIQGLAAHSRIPAWTVPMDSGAWRAAVAWGRSSQHSRTRARFYFLHWPLEDARLVVFTLLLMEKQGALTLLWSVQQGTVSEKFEGFGGISRLEHKVQKIDAGGSTCISTRREREELSNL